MSAYYEACKLEMLHYLQLNQDRWFRWTDFVTGWNYIPVTMSRYSVEKACHELEAEGLIYIKLKSTGWFNRYLVRAVSEITLRQYKDLHPNLKFIARMDFESIALVWSSKKWFYYPDKPFTYCDKCIDHKNRVIFGVIEAQKLQLHNPLADIPF